MKKIILSVLVVLAISSSVVLASVSDKTKASTEAKTSKKEERVPLSKEKAELLEKAVSAQAPKIKEIDTKLKAVRKELRELIATESFDKDAYLKKAQELSNLESEKFLSRSKAMAEIMPKFTPDERKRVVYKLSHSSKKPPSTKKPKAE